jgi:WD40 repeat protein
MFDPSGAHVLTASDDGIVRLWGAAGDGRLVVLRVRYDDDPIVYHEEMQAVFDPSGARVLTASSDGTVRLWDAASGAELAVLRDHGSGRLRAVFDRSGTRVLTASDDATARIWRVFPTVAALVAHAGAIMPRELTPAQRKQFFLD